MAVVQPTTDAATEQTATRTAVAAESAAAALADVLDVQGTVQVGNFPSDAATNTKLESLRLLLASLVSAQGGGATETTAARIATATESTATKNVSVTNLPSDSATNAKLETLRTLLAAISTEESSSAWKAVLTTAAALSVNGTDDGRIAVQARGVNGTSLASQTTLASLLTEVQARLPTTLSSGNLRVIENTLSGRLTAAINAQATIDPVGAGLLGWDSTNSFYRRVLTDTTGRLSVVADAHSMVFDGTNWQTAATANGAAGFFSNGLAGAGLLAWDTAASVWRKLSTPVGDTQGTTTAAPLSVAGLVYNGTTWDRPRAAESVQGTTGTGLPGIGPLVFDGTNWNRLRSPGGQPNDAASLSGGLNAAGWIYNGASFDRARSMAALDAAGATATGLPGTGIALQTSASAVRQLNALSNIADAITGTTSLPVGGLIYNGATWDRQRDAGAVDGSAASTGIGAAGLVGWNGGSYKRVLVSSTGNLQIVSATGPGDALAGTGGVLSWPAVYNGTTYDRQRDVNSVSGTSGTGLVGAGPMVWDNQNSVWRKTTMASGDGLGSTSANPLGTAALLYNSSSLWDRPRSDGAIGRAAVTQRASNQAGANNPVALAAVNAAQTETVPVGMTNFTVHLSTGGVAVTGSAIIEYLDPAGNWNTLANCRRNDVTASVTSGFTWGATTTNLSLSGIVPMGANSIRVRLSGYTSGTVTSRIYFEATAADSAPATTISNSLTVASAVLAATNTTIGGVTQQTVTRNETAAISATLAAGTTGNTASYDLQGAAYGTGTSGTTRYLREVRFHVTADQPFTAAVQYDDVTPVGSGGAQDTAAWVVATLDPITSRYVAVVTVPICNRYGRGVVKNTSASPMTTLRARLTQVG